MRCHKVREILMRLAGPHRRGGVGASGYHTMSRLGDLECQRGSWSRRGVQILRGQLSSSFSMKGAQSACTEKLNKITLVCKLVEEL